MTFETDPSGKSSVVPSQGAHDRYPPVKRRPHSRVSSNPLLRPHRPRPVSPFSVDVTNGSTEKPSPRPDSTLHPLSVHPSCVTQEATIVGVRKEPAISFGSASDVPSRQPTFEHPTNARDAGADPCSCTRVSAEVDLVDIVCANCDPDEIPRPCTSTEDREKDISLGRCTSEADAAHSKRLSAAVVIKAVKDVHRTKVSFYGDKNRSRHSRLYGFERKVSKHNLPHALIMLTAATLAILSVMLYQWNRVAAGCILSVGDGVAFTLFIVDHRTIGFRKLCHLSALAVVACVSAAFVILATIGLGFRSLVLVVVLKLVCVATKSPQQMRVAYFFSLVLAAAFVINVSSIYYSMGGAAMIFGPTLIACMELFMLWLLSRVPVAGLDTDQRGEVLASLSFVFSLFFAGIRLAFFLSTWQTAALRVVVGNILFSIVSEVIVEGGVMQAYVIPLIARFWPALKPFASEETIKLVLLHVSACQITEFIPTLTTALLYLIYGSAFKVSGFLMVEISDYHPYQYKVMEGLGVYLMMQLLVCYLASFTTNKTGMRHCWIWKGYTVVGALLHEALQYSICPVITAVVMQESAPPSEDVIGSGSFVESALSTLVANTTTSPFGFS